MQGGFQWRGGDIRAPEVGDISNKEAAAAFSSDEEKEDEEEEGAEEAGGVHMLAATGNLRPGPAYVWGQLGGRAEYVKNMVDSGNTVGDLVSEEFARRMAGRRRSPGPYRRAHRCHRRHRHHCPGGQAVPGDDRQVGRDRGGIDVYEVSTVS